MHLEHKEVKKPDPKKDESKTKDKIITSPHYITIVNEYLKEHYHLRFNMLTLSPEYRSWDDKEYSALDDRQLNSIWLQMQLDNVKCNDKVLEKILKSKFVTSYYPLKEYFNNLAPYDGIDYIQKLADTVKISNIESEGIQLKDLWRSYLQKWLIASVANALGIGTNHTCLTLVSNQGKGKTTWLNRLCPDSMKEYINTGHIHPSLTDKKTLNLLAEKWFINIDDQLQSILKKDFNALKSIMTTSYVSNRKVWAKIARTRPRTCSFMASVDDLEFLTDNQNRRYLVFALEKVNYKHKVPIDKVWAQAFYLLKQGEPYWFANDEITQLNKMNEHFKCTSREEEWLLKCFELSPVHLPSTQFLMLSEIESYLTQKSGVRLNLKKLRLALEKQFGKPFAKRIGGRSPRKVYPVQYIRDDKNKEIQNKIREALNTVD